MDELGYRNMWISLGVGMVVLAVGMVLLQHHDEARAVFGLVCLVLMVWLRHVLDYPKVRELEEERARVEKARREREKALYLDPRWGESLARKD